MNTDDRGCDLNFWPAFSDAMLGLVLLFLLVIVVFQTLYQQNSQDTANARQCQDLLKWSMRAQRDIVFKTDEQDHFLYHVSFNDELLFRDDDASLSESGRELLTNFAKVLKVQLPTIVEIQIRGHADIRNSSRYTSNLQLASERANSVFTFLQRHEIDPHEHTMSATSYGAYFPVTRVAGQPYSAERLMRDNDTPEKMHRNRRIELLLRYGRSMGYCPTDPVRQASQ